MLVSEHEEVNEQYEELRMENEKKDAFRNHLYKLLADRSTAGVKEPERKEVDLAVTLFREKECRTCSKDVMRR